MTEYVPAIEKMAEKGIRKWINATHSQKRLAKGKVEENVGPYIFVSRETGAGGSEVAHLVGEKLHWDVLDKEIVDYLATEYDTPRKLVEFVDEKNVSWIEDIVTSWGERKGFSSAAYIHRLNQLLLLAAHHGNVVMVGRGAQYILPRDRGFSVRILAPLDFRLAQVQRKLDLTSTQARKYIDETEKRRSAFIKTHFHRQEADPHLYDLVINVGKLAWDEAADLIVETAQAWMKRSGVTVDASSACSLRISNPGYLASAASQ